VVSTAEGVYYVNLVEQFQSLLAGSSSGKILQMKVHENKFLLTSHQNGRLKLWNVDTAE
jgi:hypothetical protein